MTIISTRIKIKLTFLAILFTLLLYFFFILQKGININTLEFGSVNIEQLYIKLDKKLILQAKNITISKNTSHSQFQPDLLSGLTQKIYFLEMFFEQIDLQNIQANDSVFAISYENNRFYFDTPYATLNANIKKQPNENIDIFYINSLDFKNFDLHIKGLASMQMPRGNFTFNGDFVTYGLNGNLNVTIAKNELKYEIKNAKALSINNFMDAIEQISGLPREIREWIDLKITAKSYELDYLRGKFDISNENMYLNEIKAKAKAKSVVVNFDKKAKPAKADQVDVLLENGTLYFTLIKPTYNDKKLDGSKLNIHHIFDSQKSGLVLNIKANTKFDSEVNNILKAYDIDVPVQQLKGNSKGNLILNMFFDPFSISTKADFTANDSQVDIGGLLANLNKATITMNNDNLDINVSGFDANFLKANAVAKFDLRDQSVKVNANNLFINIKDIININDTNASLDINFGSNLKIKEKQKGIFIQIDKESKIILSKPNEIIPYLAFSKQLGIKDFNQTIIDTIDFNKFKIKIDDLYFDLPLFLKDKSKFEKTSLNIDIDDQNITGSTTDKKITFNTTPNLININLNGLDINATSYINDQNQSKSDFDLVMKAKDTSIILNEKKIDLDLLDISKIISTIKLNAILTHGGMIKSQLKDQSFVLNIKKITDQTMNSLFGANTFKNGTFELEAKGKDTQHFKGQLNITDTYLMEYKLYNQLLSFLDTIPSLLSLKTPDFNENGFAIKKGKARFTRNENEIKFEGIELLGSSADIIGHGNINLKSKEINFDLELRFLKAATNVIGKIPLVGQIILGKDRSLSTLIKVNGTLDTPKYSTQIIQDTLLTPFKIIRNILQVPLDLTGF